MHTLFGVLHIAIRGRPLGLGLPGLVLLGIANENHIHEIHIQKLPRHALVIALRQLYDCKSHSNLGQGKINLKL